MRFGLSGISVLAPYLLENHACDSHHSLVRPFATINPVHGQLRHHHQPEARHHRTGAFRLLPGDRRNTTGNVACRGIFNSWREKAGWIILLAVYVIVTTVLVALLLVSHCTKEKLYFAFCAASAGFGLVRILLGDPVLHANVLRVLLLGCAVLTGTVILRKHSEPSRRGVSESPVIIILSEVRLSGEHPLNSSSSAAPAPPCCPSAPPFPRP